ncbi:glycosyltransferase family 2 protein [Thermotalea metallivorans]|uniref:Glycosyltransferase 2-like domain-containing protein n=1 Tax=Thermotalea metallivorans TaxID=520762 RepID=A0A140L6K0_9FIRM|nr:glycosyltransferase family A protein [Thermotalea metallivorans]KXG76175.1 hypothetical protein AN619_11320 [Thermotalea metallivorans]
MIYTVVPVKNEENKIGQTLEMLLSTKSDKIIVILNGCEDNSLEVVKNFNAPSMEAVYFNKPLGMDVPRAAGAWIARKEDAEGVVFVDGDMNGDIAGHINALIKGLREEKIDMALTNCYPEETAKSSMAKMLLSFRKQLNLELGIYDKIGYANPSHGPHGVSRRLLEKVPIVEFAIPPVVLAMAVKNNFNISASAAIPAALLQSTTRDEFHAHQIAKTIIGDCIEAVQFYKGKERTRGYDGIIFTGYHKNRRFDLLDAFMAVSG